MKTKSFFKGLEFVILIFLFASVIVLISDYGKFVPTTVTNYFIDWENGDDQNGGTNPTNDAWKTFTPALQKGNGNEDVVYVRVGIYTLTSIIQPVYGGDVNGYGYLKFIADSSGIYWSSGVVEIKGPSGSPAIKLENPSNPNIAIGTISFENFYVNCKDKSSNAIEISNCYDITIKNCDITADEYSIYSMVCDGLTIDNCNLIKTDDSGSILYLGNCDNFVVVDCSTQLDTGVSPCTTNVVINNCCSNYDDFGYFLRNQIKGNAGRGIDVQNSSNMNFHCNAIYGSFSICAVYDVQGNSGDFQYNYTTVNNTGDGEGYRGARSSGNKLISFRNNIIRVNSSTQQRYPMIIDYDGDDWKPNTSSDFSHNCYYSYYTDDSRKKVGTWEGNAQDSIGAWQSATGADGYSYELDPVFGGTYGEDYHLTVNSPNECKTGAVGLSLMDTDIDGDIRDHNPFNPPSTPLSMGADEVN